MSSLFLQGTFFLSCSMALRGDDFALCKPLTCKKIFLLQSIPNKWEYIIRLPFYMVCHAITFVLTAYLLPTPCSRPTFKLAIVLLLAGGISINPGPTISRNKRFATTNVWSVWGKTASLSELLFSKKTDILAITETWLRPHDTAACITEISPSDYTFHHRPRSVGRDDGVGFLLSDHFKAHSRLIPDSSTFESTCWHFRFFFLGILCMSVSPFWTASQLLQRISGFVGKLGSSTFWILHFWRF